MISAIVAYKDPPVGERVVSLLASAGVTAHLTTGIDLQHQLRARPWSILIFGWELPGEVTGLEALGLAKEALPDVPVLILSPFPDLGYAKRAVTLGAFDYVEVPFSKERLLEAVTAALPGTRTEDPVVDAVLKRFVGESRQVQEIARLIARYAREPDCDVMITGETGTGKDVAARALHEASHPEKKPFVAENCATFRSVGLSELFGHEKGAFTDAHRDHIGAFERTKDGTLFLDETQELSLDTQAQLLRVVETRTFRRIGGEKELPFRGRIVYSTNRDLVEAVSTREFRQDLYHRIHANHIAIPPLRERRDDIIPLAEHMLAKHSQTSDVRLSRAVAVLLSEYSYPGNVRELENVIRVALTNCSGQEILARHVLSELDSEVQRSGQHDESTDKQVLFSLPLKEAASELEKEYCREFLPWVLKSCNNNLSQAAKVAGVDPKTFRRKWEECGLPKLTTR